MGNLILCTGKKASYPFVFKETDIEVYTLEEMCYYIYNHIEAMTDELFDDKLLKWLEEQEQMQQISRKLERLIGRKNSLKDKVVTLLCSCDYYKEEEIRKLIKTMDYLENMPVLERYKRKGIYLLKQGRYKEAEKIFLEILKSKEAKQFTPEEYGNLLHNLAVTHTHTASCAEAAIEFKEAYGRNQNSASLKQYLLALKLSEQEELYQKEISQLEEKEQLEQEIQAEIEKIIKEAEQLSEYVHIRQLVEMKKSGKVSAYYEALNTILEKWKQEYKEAVD